MVRVFPAPHWSQGCDLADHVLIEAEHLTGFSHRKLSAIGDDVRCHGRAVFAVAVVHVLNRSLAFITAWKVNVDVGPFLTVFREEALEQ